MTTRFIDTHCHPQMGEFEDDRSMVIQRSLDAGIGMIVVGTTLADSHAGVALAENFSLQPVWAAVGVHPTDGDLGEIHPAQLAALLSSKKVVAIGECGLDWYRLDPEDIETRQLQADVFEQHILLASQSNLPLIIHTRDRDGTYDAYDQTLALLTRHQVSRFVMHCYSGDWTRADQFLKLGGSLSFTGILTFPKSEIMQAVAKRTPADRLMVETDAPFLAPVPFRGKRCEPAYVEFVAEILAELRDEPIKKISEQTTKNATEFFRLG